MAINPETDLKFPRRRVSELLAHFGYLESRSGYLPGKVVEFRNNNGGRAFLTDTEIVFSQPLSPKAEEQLRAQLFSILIDRIWILNQAARQNAEAAKLNLLQNQRRACASDAYYALFLALGSLIDHVKQSCPNQAFSTITDGALEEDPEDKREHLTPECAEPIADHWNCIANAVLDGQVELHLTDCVVSQFRVSRKNPFAWLMIAGAQMFRAVDTQETSSPEDIDEENQEQARSPQRTANDVDIKELFTAFVVAAHDMIVDVDLDRFAIGVSGRERFEQHFSRVFEQLRTHVHAGFSSNDPRELKAAQLALLCCVFLYAYTLRQMADYEASFDTRIGIQTVAQICRLTDLFVGIVETLTTRGTRVYTRKPVEQLNVFCSPDVVGDVARSSDPTQVLYSVGGVIVTKNLDTATLANRLLAHRAYSPALTPTGLARFDSKEPLLVNRALPLTGVVLRIAITPAGAIWIDLVPSQNRFYREIEPEEINPYVFNRMVAEYILPNEVLPHLPEDATVFMGTVRMQADTPVSLIDYVRRLRGSDGSLRLQIAYMVETKLRLMSQGLDVALPKVIVRWVRSSDDLDRIRLRNSERPVLVIIFHSIPLTATDKIRIEKGESGNDELDEVFVHWVPMEELERLFVQDADLNVEPIAKAALQQILTQQQQQQVASADSSEELSSAEGCMTPHSSHGSGASHPSYFGVRTE